MTAQAQQHRRSGLFFVGPEKQLLVTAGEAGSDTEASRVRGLSLEPPTKTADDDGDDGEGEEEAE